jgi:hypothetical protein
LLLLLLLWLILLDFGWVDWCGHLLCGLVLLFSHP